jgi:DNA-directed RNA polymerase subunit K/omega
MIHRPSDSNAFEFVRVASLRAAQLMRGCSPRVTAECRAVVTAQLEVAAAKVQAEPRTGANAHSIAFVPFAVDPVIARTSVR